MRVTVLPWLVVALVGATAVPMMSGVGVSAGPSPAETTIEGVVFFDLDRDGQFSGGDRPAPNVDVRVFRGVDGTTDEGADIDGVISGPDGRYEVAVPAPGPYEVVFAALAGWSTPRVVTVDIEAGESAAVDHGVLLPAVQGVAWLDADADLVWDSDEVAAAGVVVDAAIDQFAAPSPFAVSTAADGSFTALLGSSEGGASYELLVDEGSIAVPVNDPGAGMGQRANADGSFGDVVTGGRLGIGEPCFGFDPTLAPCVIDDITGFDIAVQPAGFDQRIVATTAAHTLIVGDTIDVVFQLDSPGRVLVESPDVTVERPSEIDVIAAAGAFPWAQIDDRPAGVFGCELDPCVRSEEADAGSVSYDPLTLLFTARKPGTHFVRATIPTQRPFDLIDRSIGPLDDRNPADNEATVELTVIDQLPATR